MVFYVWIGFLYTVVRFSSAYSIEVEPKCSKYDFEEKLLEKMIRLEHSTGIMMERFNDLSEKVENDLSTMKQEFNGIKLQVKADQGHYRKIAKEALRQPSDSFSVVWIENTAPAVNDVLKFTRILLNENDVYNVHTGEYTAQVNGTYMFTSNLCTYPNKNAKIAFLADDTLIGAFFAGYRYLYVCSYSSAISRLEKGMKVKLVITFTYGSGDILHNNNNGYLSTFAGHRIK